MPILLDAGQSERGWHRLSLALKCPALHAYKIKLGITFPETPPLVRGSLFHTGLAQYYRRVQAIQEGDDPEKWYEPIEAMRLDAEQHDARPNAYRDPEQTRQVKHPNSVPYKAHLKECIDAARAYVDHWSAYDKWKIIGVETELRTHVPDDGWSLEEDVTRFLFTQKADLIVEDPDGYYFIVDHKTRGRADNRATRAYARSGQFSGYQLFGRNAFGRKWGGCLINFVTFKAANKGLPMTFGFERVPPTVHPWRVRCFPDTVRYGERIVQDLEKMRVDPWHWPKVGIDNGCCEHRYGPCGAAEVCDIGEAALEVTDDGLDKWGLPT